MKAFVGIVAVGLIPLMSGCNQKTDTAPAPPATNSTVGNPLTAPVDYLGVLAKAKTSSEIKVDTISINNAIQQFAAMEGHFPKNLDELVTQKYYPRIPPAPFGLKYDYDANVGQVKLIPSK